MDDDFPYYQQYGTRLPTYISAPYHRSPYMISRRQYDDDYSDYYRDFKAQSRDYDRRVQTYQQAIYFIRVMAYIQIFIAGVLLVSDVSRIVLLWTFVQSASTIIEMICQLSFPLFSLILGFLSLTSALSPSSVISKSVAILLIAAIVPNFVFPKQAAFITSAVEAVDVSRATDRNLVKQVSLDMSMGMIRSTTHHKMLRMLSSTGPRWPLGIQDIASLPVDFLILLQYLLVSYAMFAFLQLVIQIITVYFIVKLLSVQ
ncbi:hypothetical protein V3C99_014113 [Haemonchus contortus]|uniref:ABC transmembrane type-1 domain-containing protein n=1 Tax=Haemonchus contortus TaxID=6289 RepID=A0A7I4YRP2_HAECO